MNDPLSVTGLSLSGFDWMILAVVVVSTLMSLRRGFVREALSLGMWIAAFVVARQFHPSMQALLVDSVTDPLMRSGLAVLALFIGTLVVGAVVSYLLGALISATGLSSTDRILGMVFGCARGALIVTLVIGGLGLTPFIDDAWYSRSTLAPYFETVATWMFDQLTASGVKTPIS